MAAVKAARKRSALAEDNKIRRPDCRLQPATEHAPAWKWLRGRAEEAGWQRHLGHSMRAGSRRKVKAVAWRAGLACGCLYHTEQRSLHEEAEVPMAMADLEAVPCGCEVAGEAACCRGRPLKEGNFSGMKKREGRQKEGLLCADLCRASCCLQLENLYGGREYQTNMSKILVACVAHGYLCRQSGEGKIIGGWCGGSADWRRLASVENSVCCYSI